MESAWYGAGSSHTPTLARCRRRTIRVIASIRSAQAAVKRTASTASHTSLGVRPSSTWEAMSTRGDGFGVGAQHEDGGTERFGVRGSSDGVVHGCPRGRRERPAIG